MTITEAGVSGYTLSSITANVPVTVNGNSATVTVVPGNTGAQVIVTFTNAATSGSPGSPSTSSGGTNQPTTGTGPTTVFTSNTVNEVSALVGTNTAPVNEVLPLTGSRGNVSPATQGQGAGAVAAANALPSQLPQTGAGFLGSTQQRWAGALFFLALAMACGIAAMAIPRGRRAR